MDFTVIVYDRLVCPTARSATDEVPSSVVNKLDDPATTAPEMRRDTPVPVGLIGFPLNHDWLEHEITIIVDIYAVLVPAPKTLRHDGTGRAADHNPRSA